MLITLRRAASRDSTSLRESETRRARTGVIELFILRTLTADLLHMLLLSSDLSNLARPSDEAKDAAQVLMNVYTNLCARSEKSECDKLPRTRTRNAVDVATSSQEFQGDQIVRIEL